MSEALPRWTHKLPGEYRIVQPHEQVRDGDYYQIGTAYALIDDADSGLYRATGGMYGTFWRRVEDRRQGNES